MTDDSHDIQTLKKEQLPISSDRKAKKINAPSRKLHRQQHKSVKKNLSSVLNSVTEVDAVLTLPEKEPIEKFSSESVDGDQSNIGKASLNSDQTLDPEKSVSLEHPEESVVIDLISEAIDFGEDQSNESIESYIVSQNEFASPTSITPDTVQLTSSSYTSSVLSSISTLEMTPFSSHIPAEASLIYVSSGDGSTTEETDSSKLESVVKHLRESMFQFLHSADVDPQYEKLLDALGKFVIEESYKERGMVNYLFSRKTEIVMLSFVLCMFAICSGFFLLSHGTSYDGPPPT